MTDAPRDRRETATLLALVVLAAALRAPGALGRPLWLDEALQAVVATAPHPWTALGAAELHPPLAAALTRAALGLGRSDLAVRLPSLLASLATVPLAAWAARAWGARTGGLAALAAAVLPPLVLLGAEARPYALGVAALTGLVGAVGVGRGVAAWATLAAATLYGAWPIVAVALLVHGSRTGRWTATLAPLATMGALATTLLPTQRAAQGAALTTGFLAPGFFTPATLPAWLATAPLHIFGWLLTATSGRTAGAVGLAALLAVAATARGRRADGLTALAWGPLPAFVVLAGLGLHPLGPTRQAVVLLPGLLAWAARRLDGRSRHAAVGVVALAALGLGVHPTGPREDVAATARATLRTEALPLVADGSAAPQLAWYGPPSTALPWARGPGLGRALDAAAPPGAFWLVTGTAGGTAADDAAAWATARGRSVGPDVAGTGARARRIGAATHPP